SLSEQQLDAFIDAEGLPAYRARQIIKWIYEKHACSIDEITELSKDLRQSLSENAYISCLELADQQISVDSTRKFLFKLEDGETIESVLIPDEDRLTLCISSQVGCAMSCGFCVTGSIGIKRDLKAHEICGQVISASKIIHPQKITNIVLMGMGEPLANFENVVEALWRITGLMHFSPRRITLSTSGIVPKIAALAQRAPMVNLAISLNATTDQVRDRVMPVNKTYPIKSLLDACRRFPLPPRRRITFEYVMLRGVNDSDADAARLIRLLRGIPSKVNLIPFNEFAGSEFRRPDDVRVQAFQEILTSSGMTAIIRKSKGQDILAACGQLKAKYSERDR
ncbi:MAG: 23S rRNA (adenine(2503)-C(2))-methyltransferase RlmN, partial [Nitrospiraceae bacterium]|nr:23S rRNA (adenine(2503)-C(2))-methyltransferase RlmN [Nitrospiraceae bacterium]